MIVLCRHAVVTVVLKICLFIFPGGSLKNYIRDYGPFRDKKFVNYTFQLLSGVNCLHQNNVVHHDIKGIYIFINKCKSSIASLKINYLLL